MDEYFDGMAVGIGLSLITTGAILTLCVAVEYASPLRRYGLMERFPGVWFILALPICSALMLPAFGAIFGSLHITPLFNLTGWPILATFVLTIIVKDFLNYWQHRCDHRFLWPFHAVHHSVTELYAANAYAHPFQAVSQFALIFVPIAVLGVGGLAVPLALKLTLDLQAAIIHCPTRVHLGPLRYLIVDSRFHRIHHSIEERHFGKNYGTVFSIWDQVFGTAYFPAEDEWPDVGLEGFPPPTGVLDYLIHPLRHFKRIN